MSPISKLNHNKCNNNKNNKILLCKADEVLVVGVHVGKLTIYQHHHLVLARLLLLPARQPTITIFVLVRSARKIELALVAIQKGLVNLLHDDLGLDTK